MLCSEHDDRLLHACLHGLEALAIVPREICPLAADAGSDVDRPAILQRKCAGINRDGFGHRRRTHAEPCSRLRLISASGLDCAAIDLRVGGFGGSWVFGFTRCGPVGVV